MRTTFTLTMGLRTFQLLACRIADKLCILEKRTEFRAGRVDQRRELVDSIEATNQGVLDE